MRYTRQEGIRDCGICCMQNIIRYYGGFIDIEKLRKLTNTNENGTSIYNIVRVSNDIGFKSKAYHAKLNDLSIQTFPFIAYTRLNEFNHFIIVEKIDFDKITVFDPIRGKLNYTFKEFLDIWQEIIITFEKEKDIVKEEDFYINYLKKVIKKNKESIYIILSLSVICALLSFIFSILLKRIFDNDIKKSSFVTYLILVFIKEIFNFIKTKKSIVFNNKVDYDLTDKVYQKIYSLPIEYHLNRPIGDISSRISDLYSIQNFLSIVTLSSMIDVLVLVFTLLLLLILNIKIFIISVLIFSSLFLIYYSFRNKENLLLEDLKNKTNDCNSKFIDTMLGINSIKNMNIEDKVYENQIKNKKKYLKSYLNYTDFVSLETLLTNYVEYFGILIIIFISYSLMTKNKITIGEITYTYTLFVILSSSFKNLINLDRNFLNSKMSYKRLHSLLNYDCNKNETKVIKDIDTINFQDISYSYEKNKIFNNFNLEIKRNENLFIYGDSGAGKSTLFRLLNKELDLKTGDIYINNLNLKDIKASSIRNNICYVSQNEYIFTDTIKNNIVLTKSFKNIELNKALKVTMLDKVLKRKNINLDYLLEDDGHNLSRGERQKIILARALLRNTDYIILDETTNEIDCVSERKIIKNILTEYKKTLILVSHRINNEDLFDKRVEI